MKICIPTLNRPNKLLTYELACNIVGKENVYVFFHNDEDKNEYLKNYDIKNWVITNKPRGIAGQRNAILKFFKKGDFIIMLNDDIKGFKKLNSKKKLDSMSNKEIKDFFINAFTNCQFNDCNLWGVYPVPNGFYMKNRINNKGFIIGTCMGIIVEDMIFDESMHTKEDYDYTLQNIIKHKKVLRFDNITCYATHAEKKGGGCSYAYQDGIYNNDFNILCNKWGSLIKINPKRENEILINI